jgi:hypothetical protein
VLAWALHQHSRFWTSAEFDFFFNLLGRGRFERAFLLSDIRATESWLARENVQRDEFLAYLGIGLNGLWTSRSGGKRWVDATPNNTGMADLLAEMFPGAHFLHILRDSRRVVHSMMHFPDMLDAGRKDDFLRSESFDFWSSDFRTVCRVWSRHVEDALQFTRHFPSRAMTVVHEELVAAPEKGCAEILDFLGAAHEDGPATLLKTTRINSSFQNTPEAAPGLRKSKPWTQWTEEHKAIFFEEIGPTLVRHGMVARGKLREHLT